MPVVNTYDGNVPTYDADEDTWGFELNTALRDQIKPTLDAYATAINANETAANGALQRAGGTMTGDQVLAASGPTNAYSSGFRGTPVVTVSANKTLALSDAGTNQQVTGGSAVSITIPPAGSVGFPDGTAIVIRNLSSQPASIVRGSGVTLTVTGASTNKDCVVAPRGRATLMRDGSNVWDIGGIGVS